MFFVIYPDITSPCVGGVRVRCLTLPSLVLEELGLGV